MVPEQNSRALRLDIVRGKDVEKRRGKDRVHPISYKVGTEIMLTVNTIKTKYANIINNSFFPYYKILTGNMEITLKNLLLTHNSILHRTWV